MMKYRKIMGSLVVCFASSILTNLAFSGAADMTTSDGSRMKFEYEGNKLRINTGSEGNYMLINNDGLYVISNSAGQTMVIDAGKMMGMLGDISSTAPTVASSEVLSLEATGKKEKQAGISGEIYNLKYVDKETGNTQTTELVLSNDPRAIEMTKAINAMAAATVKATGQNQQGSNELQEYMTNLNKGVLRYGNDMWVTAISNRTIADSRFVLPAPPTDLSAINNLADAIKANSEQNNAGGASKQSDTATDSNGLVSGFLSAFGKKTDAQLERQQERAEDQADEAVDEATDEVIDNALDKAFDKLFGD